MGLFQPRRTFDDPGSSQSGFPSPGDGAQTSGDPSYVSLNDAVIPWEAERPTKGTRSWLRPAGTPDVQRGQPSPEDVLQHRQQGSMPNVPPIYGMNIPVYTPYYSRGAAAIVQNYGKVLTNPIGAGVVAIYKPQASYGPAAQFIDNALWWTSQVIPTTINLQGLTDPAALEEIVGSLNVEAMVRTTG